MDLTESLRDDAGGQRERPLLRAPAGALLQRRPRSGATRSRTTRAARASASKRPRGGCGRCSATILGGRRALSWPVRLARSSPSSAARATSGSISPPRCRPICRRPSSPTNCSTPGGGSARRPRPRRGAGVVSGHRPGGPATGRRVRHRRCGEDRRRGAERAAQRRHHQRSGLGAQCPSTRCGRYGSSSDAVLGVGQRALEQRRRRWSSCSSFGSRR